MTIDIQGLAHVVIRVADLERSLAFYRDALGCPIERRLDELGLVQLRAGSALIDLVPVDSPLGKAGGAANERTMQALAAGEHGDLTRVPGLTGLYVRVLRAALRHPAKILAAALVGLVAVQIAYQNYGRGVEFFPEVEPDNAILQIHARGNLSIFERDALMREVEARIFELQRETGAFHAIYSRSVASSASGWPCNEQICNAARWLTAAPAASAWHPLCGLTTSRT